MVSFNKNERERTYAMEKRSRTKVSIISDIVQVFIDIKFYSWLSNDLLGFNVMLKGRYYLGCFFFLLPSIDAFFTDGGDNY